MYLNTLVVKTEKMVSFMKTKNLLLKRIARPDADTLLNHKQEGDPLRSCYDLVFAGY